MSNNENLMKPSECLTAEERRERASKAGKASVEARRKRKTLREELLALLSDEDTQERISVALIKEALGGGKANSVTKAFETIRDTIGEKPVEKVEATQTVIDMSQFTTEQIKEMLNDEI